MVIVNPDIQRELAPGERVLWEGRPLGGVRFVPQDFLQFLFGLFFFGFSLFWMYGASGAMAKSNSGPGTIFPLFGVPFVLMGFYFVCGRFLFEAFQRKYTEYAVTNQRAIIRSGILNKTTRSIDYRKIANIRLIERSNNSGIIVFGDYDPYAASWAYYGRFPRPTPDKQALEFIPDARSVYDLIRRSSATAA